MDPKYTQLNIFIVAFCDKITALLEMMHKKIYKYNIKTGEILNII